MQIAQTEDLANAASQRRNWADRALIAGPLSKICAIELGLREKLFDEIGQTIVGKRYGGEIEWDTLSSRDVDLLARCIEDAEPLAAADLSALLSELQMQQARLEFKVSASGQTNFIPLRGKLKELALDSAFISARAQRLLYYSRRNDAEYFEMPIGNQFRTLLSRDLKDFQLEDLANQQLVRTKDKWLAPIAQRTPHS